MAFAVVNQSTQVGALLAAGSSITIASTTIGNTLVVVVENGGNRTPSVTGLCSGGYTQLHQQGPLSSTWYNTIYAGVVTSSGTSITVTMNANTGDAEDRVTVIELSGGADPVAETGTSTGSTNAAATSHDAATITPSVDEVFFIAAVRLSGSSGGWTTDPEFTTSSAFTPTVQRVDYRTQSANTAQAYSVQTVTARNSIVAFAAIAGATAGGSTITPTVGSLALSGNAPTVSVSGDVAITPAAGALALAGATVTQTLTVQAPSAGTLTLAGAAPTVAQTTGATIQPAAGALTFTGVTPTVANTTPGTVITPPAGALAFTGNTPTAALSNMDIRPSAAILTFTGAAPNVSVSGSNNGNGERNRRRRGMLTAMWGR